MGRKGDRGDVQPGVDEKLVQVAAANAAEAIAHTHPVICRQRRVGQFGEVQGRRGVEVGGAGETAEDAGENDAWDGNVEVEGFHWAQWWFVCLVLGEKEENC